MRWLIDEMFPHATAKELRREGHDAVAIAEVEMLGAADTDVFDLGVTELRVIVTENFADFAALVEQRQTNDQPCTPVVFVRKSAFRAGGGLATHLAAHLDRWATENPDPYHGLHWP